METYIHIFKLKNASRQIVSCLLFESRTLVHVDLT